MLKKYLNILIIIFFTLVFINGQSIESSNTNLAGHYKPGMVVIEVENEYFDYFANNQIEVFLLDSNSKNATVFAVEQQILAKIYFPYIVKGELKRTVVTQNTVNINKTNISNQT